MSRSPRAAATIRASVLAPIVRVLDGMHVDTDGLLIGQHLKRAQLRDPYSTVLLHRYIAFLEAAAKLTGDAAFGLRVGAVLQPADLGPAGLLFSLVPTLRQGLDYLSRYLGTLQSGTKLTLQNHDGWAALTYQIEDPSIWPRGQDSELTLSTMCSVIRSRCGASWAPLEVHFEHGASAPQPVLRQIFRAPVRFMRPATQLVITASELDRPLASNTADVLPALERHAQDILDRDGSADSHTHAGLAGRVAQAISTRLGQDKISVPLIAGDLGLSARSLQRGLAAEGVSVRTLLRDLRRSVIEARLSRGDGTICQIAEAAGYSDGTVAWRAFKTWTGSSPTRFRLSKGDQA